MNITHLSRFRALAQSLRRPGDGRWSLLWRIRDAIETERMAAAKALSPVKQGNQAFGDDGQSGRNWVLFRNVHPRLVRAWLVLNGWERADVSSDHDCSGQFFARTPWVRVSGSRVLVTQSWGYDV